jgi:hypothetical protein
MTQFSTDSPHSSTSIFIPADMDAENPELAAVVRPNIEIVENNVSSAWRGNQALPKFVLFYAG